MPYADLNGLRLYYEVTGMEDAPAVLQFGGSLFGRQNFDNVNEQFRKRFKIISFDGRGYGRSDAPGESYSIEERAEDGLALLDHLGIDRVLLHGTSMGGMVALAFVAAHPERVIAAVADCALARCDLHRRTLYQSWRNMAETMPLDAMSDAVTLQSVSASFLETEAGSQAFEINRRIIGKNSLHTIRHACLAMEEMDLESAVRTIRRPVLMTNGVTDIMTPSRLAPSGFSAADVAAAVPDWVTLHEFQDIGHAALFEIPGEAADLTIAYMEKHLSDPA